jgi:hypothetical protein
MAEQAAPFFVFAAPMHWWEWLVAQVLMVRYKGIVTGRWDA